METTAVKIRPNDLMDVATDFGVDDARMAIFSINDLGFEEARRSAMEDGDHNLAAAILLIHWLRTDEGQDAVELIDMIDGMGS